MAFYVKVEDSKKLCYPLEDITQFDSEQLTAVRQLQIQGLAQMEKRMLDGQTELVYAIGGMQPLSQYIGSSDGHSQELDKYREILQNVLKLMQEIEKYPLLSVSNLVLEMDYLWVDARGELRGIYLPFMQDYQNIAVAWKKLIQDLLGRAESDAGLLFLTRQLRFLENQTAFSIPEIQKQIQMDNQMPSLAKERNDFNSSGMRAGQGAEQAQAEAFHSGPVSPQVAPRPQVMPQSQPMPNHGASVPGQAPRPNIQMMQAPNQAPRPGAPAKMPNQAKTKAPSGKPSKFNIPVLIIGHLVILLIVGGMIFAGLLKTEEGNLDLINVLLLVVIAAGGLALIWLKLAVNSKEKGSSASQSQKAAPAKGKAKPEKGAKKGVPGIAAPGTGVPGMGAPGIGTPGMGAPGMGTPAKSGNPVPPPMTPMPQPDRRPEPAQPVQPMQQAQPQFQSFYEEGPAMPEAQGTMIMPSGATPQNNGTVVFEQERGAFVVLKNGADKRKITGNPFRIGRNADWKIADSAVSGLHCQIEEQAGTYYLVDIGSKNGTLLNGKKLAVNQYQVLNHGDEIRLGNTEITFELY
ncbi:MAG: FHA domain-containing protein [Eubacteriales bacterium]|nr:FHA domain-containing protein [Eubacteriales bacterium]